VAIEAIKSIQGSDFNDPLSSEHGVYNGKLDGRFQNNKAGIPMDVFTVLDLLYAYDVSESSFKRKRKEIKEGKFFKPLVQKATHHRGTTSVIN
jgi:hypothetical protein